MARKPAPPFGLMSKIEFAEPKIGILFYTKQGEKKRFLIFNLPSNGKINKSEFTNQWEKGENFLVLVYRVVKKYLADFVTKT